MASIPALAATEMGHDSFGSYLRFLRRRARITQTELSVAVGYSPGQISMLESGQRHPNVTAVMALFIVALGLQHDTQAANRLIELAHAAAARAVPTPAILVSQQIEWRQEEIGTLEEIPPRPSCFVARAEAEARLAQWLKRERWAAVCGLPGMGKSTLAATLAHASVPKHPVFWRSFEQGLDQAPEDLLRQLALFVLVYGSPAIQTALLRRIAGGETPGPLRQQLFHVAGALNSLNSPLLVFDDAHLIAANGQMMEVLQGVRSHAANCRLLLSTREELDLPGLPHLMLQGLARDEARDLVAAMGLPLTPTTARALTDVDAETRFDPLFTHTAGNPLLLRLAVGQLEQAQTIVTNARGLTVAHSLVTQVVAQLPPAARWLLDWLVVWHNVQDLTDPALVAWLSEQQAPYDHAAMVEQLRRKRIIDHDTHAFLHPLLREPLLATLNVQPRQRQAMHQMAAAWAEKQGDRVKAAYHHTAVGDLVRACALLETGGENATISPAQAHTATAVLDEMLAQLQHQAESPRQLTAQLLALRGDLLINTLRANEARANYRAAIDLTVDPHVRAHLAQRLAHSLLRIGHAQDARALCEHALHSLEGDQAAATMSLRLQLGGVLGRAYIAVGQLDDAAALCQEALAAARQLQLTKPTKAEKISASAYHGLGYICRRQANNEQARIYFERAIVHARNAGADNEEAESLNYLSVMLRELGDFGGAEQQGRRALEVAQRAGNEYLAANILHRLSITSYYHNELKLALERSEQATALQRKMGDAGGTALCDSLQALVYTSLGELEEAVIAINRARQESQLLDNDWLQGMVLYVYGIVHTLNGNLPSAETALRAALQLDDYVRDLPLREGVLLFLGINAVAQGNLEEARRIESNLAGNVTIEVELLSGLFRGMAAIGGGDLVTARAIAATIRQRAQESGYLIYAFEANQLLAAVENPPPLAHLPRFICLHTPTPNR